jgi:hypothetical protein
VQAAMTTDSNNGQLFQFKFDSKNPLIYAIVLRTRGMNDSHSGQRSSLSSNSSEIRYKIRLTAAGTNSDGTTAVYYEPFDFEEDLRSTGQRGELNTSVRGLAIVEKQDGVVIIDTEKGIGLSQSQSMKQSVYPNLLCGYFDFEPTGRIKKFEGDLPFVDTWQNTLKTTMNFFNIDFPTNAIALHDAWTNDYNLKTSGGVVFHDEGIVQPWNYTRELDGTATNSPIASFSLYESDNAKDMECYLDQPGQQTSVDLAEHASSINATFQFDQKLGRLISMKKSDRGHDDINMVVQGNPVDGHLQNEADFSMTLISP